MLPPPPGAVHGTMTTPLALPIVTPSGSSRTSGTPTEPVTVTVARRVAPGREADFERWYDGIIAAASTFPGFLGAGALRPHRAGQDWHVVYRFCSPAALRRWEESTQRREWLERGEHLMAETGVQRVTGLETWFALPGRTAPAPPRWKMALLTLAAIYPLALVINVLVLPRLVAWPVALRVLALGLLLVPTMTWVVMPRLTRLSRRWLYPAE
jgi:uncharacterized protein